LLIRSQILGFSTSLVISSMFDDLI
jgi:hypothetical protein